MESSQYSYMQNILNIVKHLCVQLKDDDDANIGEQLQVNSACHLGGLDKNGTSEKFRILNLILRRSLMVYSNSCHIYFNVRNEYKLNQEICCSAADEDVLSTILPMANVEFVDLPNLAEVIAIILTSLVDGSANNADSSKYITYLENAIINLEMNIKLYLMDSCENLNFEIRILLNIVFKLFIKHDWMKDNTAIKIAFNNIIELFISSISQYRPNSVSFISTILNYGFGPILKYKAIKNELDALSYFDSLWITTRSIFYKTYSKYKEDGDSINTAYLMLCFLVSFDDNTVSTKFCVHVMNDCQFWNMLKFGLVQSDTLIRKRSLLIFKRIFEVCHSNEVSWKTLDKSSPILQSLLETSHSTAWIDYFIIMESLDEPQVHLLKPIFSKLTKLYTEAVSKFFIPVDWILILFERAFSHCNKNVQLFAISLFLKQNIFNKEPAHIVAQFTVSHLLSSLSNSYLFSDSNSENNINIGTLLPSFMSCLYDSCDEDSKEILIKNLLKGIFDGRPWGSVPLFYIVRSIPLLHGTQFWTYEELNMALHNYKRNLSTHDQVIRSAVQCQMIKLILQHAGKNLSLMQLSSFIKLFNRHESWKRNSYCWDLIIDFYCRNWNFDLLINDVHCCIKKNEYHDVNEVAVAYCIIIAISEKYDHNNTAVVSDLLLPHLLYLKNSDQRPYLNITKVEWVLKLLTELLEILYCDSLSEKKFENSSFQRVIFEDANYCQNMLSLLINYDDIPDIKNTNFYSCIVNFFNSLKISFTANVEKIWNILRGQFMQYMDISLPRYSVYQDFSSKNILIYEFVIINFYEAVQSHHKQMLLKSFQSYLCEIFTSSAPEESVEKLTLKPFYNIFSYIALKEPHIVDLQIVSSLPLLISTASKDVVTIIFQLAKNLMIQILQTTHLDQILISLLKAVQDYRKGCSLNRVLVSIFGSILFHPKLLMNKAYHCLVLEYSQTLMRQTEDLLGISIVLTQSLITTLNQYPDVRILIDVEFIQKIFLALALSGTTYQKQLKVTKETILFIASSHCQEESVIHPNESEYESDKKARVMAIRFLVSLNERNSEDQTFVAKIALAIQQYFQQKLYQTNLQTKMIKDFTPKNQKKLRDFPNSYHHRLKTRLLQLFILTIPFLNEDECKHHLHWLCSVLSEEQQQASIRFFIEWILAILCLRNVSLIPFFIQEFDQGVNNRLGCTASFLASLSLIACASDHKIILEEVISKILPWTMSNHYNIRLYAQSSLKNLWVKVSSDKKYEEIITKYFPIYDCLFSIEDKMVDEHKNVFALQSEFMFSALSPLEHFSLQTIFYEIPRLSQISCDEWISPEYIQSFQNFPTPSFVSLKLFNSDSKLSEAESPLWVKKSVGTAMQDNNYQMAEDDYKNVQKKMTPWRSMLDDVLQETRPTTQTENCELEKQKRKSNLIVVASLIDKLPNLGGLCRTCEIFGVEKYCISSLPITQELQFTALSLTAHQWVPIQEVKSRNVKDFLLEKRDDGYCLVGLEQTAHSISIDKFTFLKKTVILLGNEREGIPCDLIQLMDACIEIPQTGILRSLNVHVSGAIAMWEYTRQMRDKCPK